MKKLLLIPLLLLLTSCSLKDNLMTIFTARENPTVQEVSLGKYETPNGKEYGLFQYGTGFYVKNGSGVILELTDIKTGSGVNTNTGSVTGSGKMDINTTTFKDISIVKKLLDSKNPLIVDKHTTPNGKEYQVTNYKGVFGIVYPDGKKGTGTFETKEGLIKFLDENNGVCHISSEKYIEPWKLKGTIWEGKSDEKMFDGKMRIVSFDIKKNCNGGSMKISMAESFDNNFVGGVGLKYDYMDIFGESVGFEGGYGESYEEPKKIKEEIIYSKDGRKGNINVDLYKDGKYDITAYISDVSFKYIGKLNKEQLDGLVDDFKFILTTFKVSSKNPYFNWYSLDKNIQPVFGIPDSNSITFTDKKGIVKIVKAKQEMSWNMCNGDEAVSTGLFCSFIKYDSKTNSIVIKEDIDRNFGLPSESTTYSINIDNGKVKKLGYKCTDGYSEKCQDFQK